MTKLKTPLTDEVIQNLKIYDTITISGSIYTGRDAVLPRLVRAFREKTLDSLGLNLQGCVIFHTAVSPAGVGPTSSNKVEIESSLPALSEAGVKIHLGKGSLDKRTVVSLKQHNSIYAVTPPVTALFSSKVKSRRVAAFAEEGMEALYELEVEDFPAIVAIAHGVSIFEKGQEGQK